MTAPAPGDPDMVGFGVNWFLIEYDEEVTFLEESLTPIITPVADIVANECATFGAVKGLFR